MAIFRKILIANRGEIAVRIIKTARQLGIKVVAIYDNREKDSLHVQLADEAFSLGSGELSLTYLNITKIITIATNAQCEAIHPGYGFLSENAEFVKACNLAKITFIGPSAKSMQIMGNKIAAREFITKLNIPTAKGLTGTSDYLIKTHTQIPFPILIKAAAGGGGKGMRIVRNSLELVDGLAATSREAQNYFNDGTVYLEQYIENPRHIEIQVMGDSQGNIVHLYERECSIQRRYQKIIEESPSPTLDTSTREQMCEAAVKIAKAIGYINAGTLEFLVDQNLNFYFLEMNTRIQVEHPVTEMVTGIDIVAEQIKIASGQKLSFNQNEIVQRGHAIESRIYAEDPENGFIPQPGKITLYHEPKGPLVRVDAALDSPIIIHEAFDPMISKLVIWADTRQGAINETINALKNYHIHGIKTNLSYLRTLINNDQFRQNKISTHFCSEYALQLSDEMKNCQQNLDVLVPISGFLIEQFTQNVDTNSVWNSIGYWRSLMQLPLTINDKTLVLELTYIDNKTIEFITNNTTYKISNWSKVKNQFTFTLNGNKHNVFLSNLNIAKRELTYNGIHYIINRNDVLVSEVFYSPKATQMNTDGNTLYSPMPGKIIKIEVESGQQIKKGDALCIIEAMKMENTLHASKDALIEKINITLGDAVSTTTPLMVYSAIEKK